MARRKYEFRPDPTGFDWMSKLMLTKMKGLFYSTPATKLAALTMKKQIMGMKKEI